VIDQSIPLRSGRHDDGNIEIQRVGPPSASRPGARPETRARRDEGDIG
jgi:hypothetical protein